MAKDRLAIRICKKLKIFFPSESLYLKTRFRLEMGYSLHLKAPKTFSEKLQWLKLYDRRPEYTTMVDKYAVKEYVANIIGKDYIIPTIGVWDKPEDIDWDTLPNSFVLKTTHGGGGGGVVLCRDKSTIDKHKITEQLSLCLKQDIAKYSCEWPYKNVKRRIIAESIINPVQGDELLDYKFFCFNGRMEFMKVDIGRFGDHHANYYNRDFELLPFGEILYLPDVNAKVDKPNSFEKMIILAEKLAKGIPFLRVDMYNTGNNIYFGELTFYPASGLEKYVPEEWDEKIGKMLTLPDSKNNK